MRKVLLLTAMCFALLGNALAQQMVTGTVTSQADGMSLPGVNVTEKGTTNGTITDSDGKYSLKVASGKSTLIFSFIGMKTIEIGLNNQTKLSIAMDSEDVGIDEVVVTAALGIKRQEKSMGYITQNISGKNIVQSNSRNVVSSLSGKLAGVNIVNSNQIDGGSTRIVIRGNNNITGNNQPLFIVDGMPVENNIKVNMGSSTSENTSSVQDYGSGINFLNSDDIEEMNILKGPAAAALYGARGANGVVLITTKKVVRKAE
mgnify:CR=1 FL=1